MGTKNQSGAGARFAENQRFSSCVRGSRSEHRVESVSRSTLLYSTAVIHFETGPVHIHELHGCFSLFPRSNTSSGRSNGQGLMMTPAPIDQNVAATIPAPAAAAAGVAPFLSVRTAFDLYLKALELPRGSLVVCSALTIPDMVTIFEEHGLVPVPVDLDPDTLAPEPGALESEVERCGGDRGGGGDRRGDGKGGDEQQQQQQRVRAIYVAHVFGAQVRVLNLRGLAISWVVWRFDQSVAMLPRLRVFAWVFTWMLSALARRDACDTQFESVRASRHHKALADYPPCATPIRAGGHDAHRRGGSAARPPPVGGLRANVHRPWGLPRPPRERRDFLQLRRDQEGYRPRRWRCAHP